MSSLIVDPLVKNQQPDNDIQKKLAELPKPDLDKIIKLISNIKNKDLMIKNLNRELEKRDEKIGHLKKLNTQLELSNIELSEKYINLMRQRTHDAIFNHNFNKTDNNSIKEINTAEMETVDSESELESDCASPRSTAERIITPVSVAAPKTENPHSMIETSYSKQIKDVAFSNTVDSKPKTPLLPESDICTANERTFTAEHQKLLQENKKLREVIKTILARKKVTFDEYLKTNYYENSINEQKRKSKEYKFKLYEITKLLQSSFNLNDRELYNNYLHSCFTIEKLLSENDHLKETLKEFEDLRTVNNLKSEDKKVSEKKVIIEPQSLESSMAKKCKVADSTDDNLDSGINDCSTDISNEMEPQNQNNAFEGKVMECPRCNNTFRSDKKKEFEDHLSKCTDD